MVSLMLGFMSTSGLIGWLNIRGIECALSVSDEIYSNRPTLVTLKITNSKRFFDSYLLSSNLLQQISLLKALPNGETVPTSIMTAFTGRGKHAVNSVIVSSPFPVNFFVRGVEIPLDKEFTVFPEPLRNTAEQLSETSSTGVEQQRSSRGADGEMLAIAEYTGVEPLRRIHWRLSARHDWFKVKESGATAGKPVILDITANRHLSLESRVSQAAFMINRLSRENRMVGLRITDDRVIHPSAGRAHRLRLLKELALYS